MQNKLQELTEKIYQEGISKGNEEAERIISGARTESEKIIKGAEKERLAIIAGAEKEAADLMEKTLSGLKMSFQHAMITLKQEIERVIICKLIEDPASEIFSDSSFVASLIKTVVDKWSPENKEAAFEIYVPEGMMDEIEQYLGIKTTSTLSEGIILHPVKSMVNGFEVRPDGKEYKISVTEDDFSSYIKEILRPKLVDLLFEKDK